MTLGNNIIGGFEVQGTGSPIRAIEAATGSPMEPEWNGASEEYVQEACKLAADAAVAYRQTPAETRARFLEAIADNILALGDELIERCMAETGLPRARVEGERGRTIGQLRLIAEVVRTGSYLDVRHDPALPDRLPAPRPDLRLQNLPVGPVVVFGASNFPLAFSVAGGDTASALAAGCPVIVKAHSAHPGTSELVGRAVRDAVSAHDLPPGVFALIYGGGKAVGQALVADPRISAVGFTGSRAGGTALMNTAAARPRPIPVFAEMSSINPVFLFPGALEERAESIGRAFVGALTLGAGQFCTNPGLVIAVDGAPLDRFVSAAQSALEEAAAQVMLTPQICSHYRRGVEQLANNDKVEVVGRGQAGDSTRGQAGLYAVSAEQFLADSSLQDEIFGATSLVVRCADTEDFQRVVAALEGQLTCALHLAETDKDAAWRLLPQLEDLAGRILCDGFGTGVEVAHAMVHGGPFPATSDGRSTSVGSCAIERWLRPVCYQDVPEDLLPVSLRIA